MPLDECPTPRSGIRGRDRSRTSVQLLDRAGPLVDDAMKQANKTAPLDITDPAHQARHSASHSSAQPWPPLAADGTFNAVFESSGEALVIIDPSDIEHPPALNLFDAHLERRNLVGLIGRGAKPPPQLGHTLWSLFSTQSAQNVHS